MDDLTSLQMKEALLEQELKTIRLRIQYVRLIESQQSGSSATDSQSPVEQVVDLLKIKTVPSSTQQKSCLSLDSSSTKEQTAGNLPKITIVSSSTQQRSSYTSGSSPTKKQAGDLRKITIESSTTQQGRSCTSGSQPSTQQKDKDQSSRLISQEVNLRPNQGIKINSIPEDLNPQKNKTYYAVFNGLNAGIYEKWETAKRATDGVPNVRFKKFKSLLEATTAAKLFAKEHLCSEAKLINNSDCLKPNTFSAALKQPKKTKVSLGKPISPPKETITEDDEDLCLAGFEYWYSAARNASEEQLTKEHYFTTDNANLSYYNYLKNSNPVQVYESFQYGLVKMIYPSYNLQELKAFPKAFISAIKKFRQNCLKADQDIYVKVNSSIPVFRGNQLVYRPHHIIQVGISKGEKYSPSKIMSCTVEVEDLQILAKQKYGALLDKAFSFKDENKIFCNFSDARILLFSKNNKTAGKEDISRIIRFQNQLIGNKIFGDHYEDMCKMIKDKADPTFTCSLCQATADIKSSLKVDPSTNKSNGNYCFDTEDMIFGPAVLDPSM